jgi:uncharacterized protein (TIGR03435 family)
VIRDEYLTGGPGWMDSDHFDVIAKTAPGTPKDTMRLMLQKALADRFHLAVHREQKPMTVFVLAAGKGGPKIVPAAGSGIAQCKGGLGGEGLRHWACQNTTMADLGGQLASLARAYIDQPVIDQTGLSGTYDFEFDWYSRRDAGATPGSTIFDAMEKLGLKLEERKQAMPVIVIEHVDRGPEEN